jgi:hypothetical protein
MKSKIYLGRGAAVLACTASLAGTALAVAPVASARAASTCANKSVAIQPEEGGRVLHIPVKAITVEGGVSCAEAYKVIAGGVAGKPPSGWKISIAHFEAPEGLVPEIAKKGSKKIKFAIQGG